MDIVFIQGLEAHALIGVYEWERLQRQALRLDLEMGFDNRVPAASDDVADTIDYANVSETLIALCAESQFRLVEALAEKLAAEVLERFDVQWLRLRVTKPDAVRAAQGVGVQIERTREASA
ncbi:dihydroneopterin aldolase [Pseudoxanthomonas kalamensis DSM 18571]|uniref:dihydroneopterin aldolase n=1 Tax=Pseudoxanthomonas kalamensis TaxID=289483 RepID=UPI0013913B53|nr:dihydroneopterin aldolase [Pseudoxanthomonas kalamensis]KAF1712146.1 dihydroneopterin aldolase [Pseudoxanthomonas kalamensis DSM 18571]